MRNSKKGFTLAEVLITLAIIGVVATMTIPTLVANYQEKSWDTSATVFERKLTEALKVMNTQATLAGYSTTESFVGELSKHLKITKICENDKLMNCFSSEVIWGSEPEIVDMNKIKTARNFGHKTWSTNIVGAQFANGTTALIAYNPKCTQDPYSNQITGQDCLAILYDTTGYKAPNTSRKDLRNVNVTILGNICAHEVDGICFGEPFIPSPLSYNECVARQEEFGIDTCMNADSFGLGGSYWNGAVQACHDMGLKLASESEMGILKDYYRDNLRDQLAEASVYSWMIDRYNRYYQISDSGYGTGWCDSLCLSGENMGQNEITAICVTR